MLLFHSLFGFRPLGNILYIRNPAIQTVDKKKKKKAPLKPLTHRIIVWGVGGGWMHMMFNHDAL